MLNPRKRQIQGVLKNETWINTFILVKYKIFYSCMEFKIASNIIKGEWLYTKTVKLLIGHTVNSSKNGSIDYNRAKRFLVLNYTTKVYMHAYTCTFTQSTCIKFDSTSLSHGRFSRHLGGTASTSFPGSSLFLKKREEPGNEVGTSELHIFYLEW
jgi:hypothetical protein